MSWDTAVILCMASGQYSVTVPESGPATPDCSTVTHSLFTWLFALATASLYSDPAN